MPLHLSRTVQIARQYKSNSLWTLPRTQLLPPRAVCAMCSQYQLRSRSELHSSLYKSRWAKREAAPHILYIAQLRSGPHTPPVPLLSLSDLPPLSISWLDECQGLQQKAHNPFFTQFIQQEASWGTRCHDAKPVYHTSPLHMHMSGVCAVRASFITWQCR